MLLNILNLFIDLCVFIDNLIYRLTMAKPKSRLGKSLSSLIARGSETSDNPDKGSKNNQPSATASLSGPKTPKTKVATTSVSVKPEAVSNNTEITESPFREIAITSVDPNPYQPRMDINPEPIRELAQSIEKEGLLQPIVVRKRNNRYELIAGERRWQACKSLKKETILARIVEASDSSSAVISLVENLQRENLNPIDEAMGYASLMRDFDLTQEAVSERVGKARATIANALRLTQLEQEIQGYLAKGIISVGHAKVLLGLENGSQRLLMARRIIEGKLSVREAEKIVQTMKRETGLKSLPRPVAHVQSALLLDLQKKVSTHLSSQVKIKHGPNNGRLVIHYKGNEDLNRILEKMGFISSKNNFAA